MSKGPVRACLGMLADIARPESNGEVTNGIISLRWLRRGLAHAALFKFPVGTLARSTAGFAQGCDFVTAAGLRARVSICSQGNSNRTGDSRFCDVPNP